MKTVFFGYNLIVLSIFFTSCVSLTHEKFTDETYPSNIIFPDETANGNIFYENENLSKNDLKIQIKKGIKYSVSNPLLALSGNTAENGSFNFFFNPFSGDDGNFMKQKYKVNFTVDGVEQKIKQTVLIYKDNRGRQYIKRFFTVNGASYKFQNSISNLYVKYPYMFCEITKGDNIYKIFTVGENFNSEKRFIDQGIKNENQNYIVILNGTAVASFTKKEYRLYTQNSQEMLKKSIAIISSVFRFIEENEKKYS